MTDVTQLARALFHTTWTTIRAYELEKEEGKWISCCYTRLLYTEMAEASLGMGLSTDSKKLARALWHVYWLNPERPWRPEDNEQGYWENCIGCQLLYRSLAETALSVEGHSA